LHKTSCGSFMLLQEADEPKKSEDTASESTVRVYVKVFIALALHFSLTLCLLNLAQLILLRVTTF